MESNERCQHLLGTALNMEIRGQAFYAQAVRTCQNPLGRAMLQKLHDDEVVHVGRIERLFKLAKAGSDGSKELQAVESEPGDLVAFLGGLAKSLRERITAETTDLQALDLGLEFERSAVHFYEAELAQAQSVLERRFLQRMVEEERSHVTALTELRAYLVDPQAWFKAHEDLVADG